VTVAFIFACLAQETGRVFRTFPPLVAYSIDIGGSIAGIVAFTAHAYVGGGPLQWLVVASLFMALLGKGTLRLNAVLMGAWMAVFLVASSPAHEVRWSPYQRLDVRPLGKGRVGYDIRANQVGHQSMEPVGAKEPMYDWPYTGLAGPRGRSFKRVLVIGAGSGNDVAYALHHGAERVDAVEIDPEIVALGRAYHPAKPYDDARVAVYVDDGRSFMERATGRYDLVVFGLPDSLALLSGHGSIRLESFLFTLESFQQARRLLVEDGVLVMYNYYRRAWIVDKLSDMLELVFGHAPAVERFSRESTGMLAGLAVGATLGGESPTRPRMFPSTDEWPFLYMERPHLPDTYLWVMAILLLCALAAVTLTGHARVQAVRANMPFLLTGAAFMLLEAKSVVQFALLFGATWLVNALVFVAVLVSVLMANVVVSRARITRPSWLFVLFLLSVGVQMVLPLHVLLRVEWIPLRYLVASLVLISPVFLANLVFGYLFRDVEQGDTAFGWNLMGTMLGGALEYLSIALGYQTLAFVVALLYGACAAWVFLVSRPSGLATGASSRG
jgi:SAM-dependent methyltransferase